MSVSDEETQEGATEKATPELDDDLQVIEANDKPVDEGDNFAVFEQGEGLIAWTIQNLTDEEGKMRSKRQLRLDPPVLRIEDGGGGEVNFTLTREFTKSLNGALEEVRLATYGIEKSKKPFASFREALVAAAMEKPVGTVLLAALVVAFPLVFIFG